MYPELSCSIVWRFIYTGLRVIKHWWWSLMSCRKITINKNSALWFVPFVFCSVFCFHVSKVQHLFFPLLQNGIDCLLCGQHAPSNSRSSLHCITTVTLLSYISKVNLHKWKTSFYILVVFLLTTWTSVEHVCLPYLFIYLFCFIYLYMLQQSALHLANSIDLKIPLPSCDPREISCRCHM